MRLAAICALGVFLASAAPAFAGVDVRVGNGSKVRGTLSAGETEVLRVTVRLGAKLSVTIKGKKTKAVAAPTVTFAVTDDEGFPTLERFP